jgi:hypothetical protein
MSACQRSTVRGETIRRGWLPLAGDQPGQRGQDGAAGPGGFWVFGVALEHGDLVAQDQNLGVFGQL